jgi:hypothetical protein
MAIWGLRWQNRSPKSHPGPIRISYEANVISDIGGLVARHFTFCYQRIFRRPWRRRPWGRWRAWRRRRPAVSRGGGGGGRAGGMGGGGRGSSRPSVSGGGFGGGGSRSPSRPSGPEPAGTMPAVWLRTGMCPEETSTDPKSYQPPVYDYGVNVIYQGNDVYVDGKKTATAAEYSQQAIALANEPATPPPPPTRPEPGQQPQWLPIPDEARTYCHAKVRVRQLGGATIGPSDHRTIGPSDSACALLGRSIWRPLQGASLLVDLSPFVAFPESFSCS